MNLKDTESRTEDIVLHEKRAAAQECVDRYMKKRKTAVLVTWGFACVLLVPTLYFGLRAYDSGRAAAAIAAVAAYAVLVLCANLVTGAVLSKSVKYYVTMTGYRSAWCDLIRRLEKIEEKAAEKTAFENDVHGIEAELEKAAVKITAFCEKYPV